MEINEILEKYIPQETPQQEAAKQQYDVKLHKVFQERYRPKKEIVKPTGEIDADGKEIMQTSLEDVNRIAFAFQQTVVSVRKHFMNLNNSKIYANDENSVLLARLKEVRQDNKYNYKINQLATAVMSELSAGELWYVNEAKEVKMQLLSPSRGDYLAPVWDRHKNLVAVVRTYTDLEDNEVTEIYRENDIHTFIGEEFIGVTTHNIGKIPIVLYEQALPEWHMVQDIIERYETLMSNFADTNDYNGAPIIVVKGQIEGFASKGERGKIVEIEEGAEMNYLSWDSAPESIALELKELKEAMHKFSHTPDISMEALKGMGLSGVAFDRVFIDAQLTAEDKLFSDFGESMQRSVNLVKHILVRLEGLKDEPINIELEAFRFNDLESQVKMLIEMSGVTMSQETAVKLTAVLQGLDPRDEWERFQAENDLMDVNV